MTGDQAKDAQISRHDISTMSTRTAAACATRTPASTVTTRRPQGRAGRIIGAIEVPGHLAEEKHAALQRSSRSSSGSTSKTISERC